MIFMVKGLALIMKPFIGYIILAIGIFTGIAANSFAKISHGFTKLTPTIFAPENSTLERFAEINLASLRFAPDKLAPDKFAPSRFASERFWPDKSAPVSSQFFILWPSLS